MSNPAVVPSLTTPAASNPDAAPGGTSEMAGLPRSGGELLVESLRIHDVSLWTCVPGESFLAILDALYERRDQPELRVITTRHEAAAANMAEAAGKLTGRAAVCLVTRGPGATHAGIALHTAYQDGTPLILVVGQVARADLGRGAFQEMDYGMVFGASAKSVVTIMEADRIPEHVARAVYTAHAGRPGPVVLVVPEDVLTERSTVSPGGVTKVVAPMISAKATRLLSTELECAERPVLVVGGPGWSQTIGEQIVEFAERNKVPIAAAFRWQDCVHNDSLAYAGYLGLGCSGRLRDQLARSDLVVAFGSHLDDPTTNGFQLTDRAERLLLVSQGEDEPGLGTRPDAVIHCSLASAAEMLRAIKLTESAARDRWFRSLRDQQTEFSSTPAAPATPGGPDGPDGTVDLAAVVRHVRQVLPDDAIVTNGAGNYTVWLQRYFQFRRFGTQLAPRNGAMGYGLPAALAAASVGSGRRVVAFAGDGCFLMSGSELATAAQHGLRLVVIVVDNSMFGTIRMHQERQYPGRTIATDLRNPDFVAYAESFGVLGLRVSRTSEFSAAFAQALEHPGPALIELRTDPGQLTPDRRLATAIGPGR